MSSPFLALIFLLQIPALNGPEFLNQQVAG